MWSKWSENQYKIRAFTRLVFTDLFTDKYMVVHSPRVFTKFFTNAPVLTPMHGMTKMRAGEHIRYWAPMPMAHA
jgi:hypothetical protein